MREKTLVGEATFGSTAGRREGSPPTGVHREKWHLLSCHLDEGEEVFMKTVGIFDVSSASQCWSRVAAAIGRLTQHTVGRYSTTRYLLLSDDFHLEVVDRTAALGCSSS